MGGRPTDSAHEARRPGGRWVVTRHRRLAGARPVPEGDLPPLVFAADLAWAVAALRPGNEATLDAIATVLGLGAAAPAAPEPVRGGSGTRTAGTAVERAEPQDESTDALDSSWLEAGLVTLTTKLADPATDLERPGWFAGTEPMAPPAPRGPASPIDPLFLPRWTRAILSGALSVRSLEGPLDIDRIVERVAELQPMAILPRLPIPTTRFGVQLLVDTGDAMMPWSRDVPQLREAIVSVFGRDRCRVLLFDGSPTRGVGGPGDEAWAPWAPPAGSTAIAVISDLGTGRPMPGVLRSTTREWLTFAAAARRARTPVVAFVPYPAGRVPASIRRAMTVVSWDRVTSSRVVHRAVGRGLHGVAG